MDRLVWFKLNHFSGHLSCQLTDDIHSNCVSLLLTHLILALAAQNKSAQNKWVWLRGNGAIFFFSYKFWSLWQCYKRVYLR